MDPQDTRPTGWAKRHQMALTLLAFVLPMTIASDKALADHTTTQSWSVDAMIYDDDPAGCLITYVQAQRAETAAPRSAPEVFRMISVLINRADGQPCSSDAVGTSGVALGYINESQLTLEPRLTSGTLGAVVPMSSLSDGSVLPSLQVALQFNGITGTLSPSRSTGGSPGAYSVHQSGYSRTALVSGVLSDGVTNSVATAALSSAVLRSDKTFVSSPKPVLLR
jgi:hypothetical protein